MKRVLLLVLFWPALAAATTYTVPGTGGATIQACANIVNAGDTCVVATGTYTETVTITRSGTSGNPVTIRSATTHGAVLTGKFVVSANYVVVSDFTIRVPNVTATCSSGLSACGIDVNGSNNVISGNSIGSVSTTLPGNNTGIVLDQGSSSNTVSGNYVNYLCFGMFVYGTDHVVNDNELDAMGNAAILTSCGDVDYVRFFGAGHIFRHNYFHGVDPVVYTAADAHHTDCFQTYDTNGDHITNVVIDGNICGNMRQGVMVGTGDGGNSNLTVRNNVFYNFVSWCADVKGVIGGYFYNNTCDTTAGGLGLFCGGTVACTCEFKNNIIYGQTNAGAYGIRDSATLIDGTVGAPGKKNLLYRSGYTYSGFADDIKDVDPLFIDRTGRNYQLQATSPAKEAGYPITGWASPTDLLGVTRPQGSGWDIGAYEISSGTAPNAPTRVWIGELE